MSHDAVIVFISSKRIGVIRPDMARGGTDICLIDPASGRIVPVT